MISILSYEFALSLRRLFRRRAQTVLMLTTFSVSIALCVVSWSLFHTMFLQNPDFDSRGELRFIAQTDPKVSARALGFGRMTRATREDFEAWKEQQSVFKDLAPVMLYNTVIIATEQGAERFFGANLSAEAFRMVGAVPLMGRLFTSDEDKLNCTPVIILSEGTWRNQFGADPAIIGRVLRVDGLASTVVGVMPASFRFPNSQQVWLPLGRSALERAPTDAAHDMIGRLKPGISAERAADDLRLITERRGAKTNAAVYGLVPLVVPFREYYLVNDVRNSALVLLCLSAMFVLVSCANAANLVLMDFFGRISEIACSLSLGISRGALTRGLCWQVGLVAAASIVISLLVLISLAPIVHQSLALMNAPYWLTFSLQWHHIAMAVGLAVLSAGISLLAPLSYLFLLKPERIIREGTAASRGNGRGTFRRVLLLGQIAMLTLLGVHAVLLLRSSEVLGDDSWGYDASKIYLGKTVVREVDVPTRELRAALQRRIAEEVARVPGVVAAAVMNNPIGYSHPPSLYYATTPDGLTQGRSQGVAMGSSVSRDLFRVIDTPFVEGETLPAEDEPAAPTYAVIKYSLAQRLWPGQAAFGRALYTRWGAQVDSPVMKYEVRGVVRDFKAAGPKTEQNDFIFIGLKDSFLISPFLLARGERVVPSGEEIRNAVRRVDPRVASFFPDSLKHQIDMTLAFVHLTTRFTLVFALAGALLGAVGIYSITVAQILQRNREFGIRLALGIAPAQLWIRFVRGHLVTVTFGVALGLAGAVGSAGVVRALLFGVKERDPLTFVAVSVSIVAISVLACLPSFFRLRRIKPADCLRSL